MLDPKDIAKRITLALPGAVVEVRDLTGTGDHFEARVVAAAFEGMAMLDQHQARMRLLWEHSLRVAFYSFLLARDYKKRRDILDDVYVAGILHDLGFIAVTTLHPRTQEKMRKFSVQRNLPPRILERFSFGMNHADIGAMIAEKWRFPDQLIEGIKYHHDPLLARAAFKDVVFCVYLANAICDVEREMISFRQLDRSVLADFGIDSEERFAEIASRLKGSYDNRRSQLAVG